jgi:DNA gyrase subunit A
LPNDNIISTEISEIYENNMSNYMISTLKDRALADIRDGCKPVHRRIIYTMHDGGFFSNRPYRKSAKIVGDCMGNFHPHGNASIYDAMSRMAQPFSLNVPLVDGHGNFGSIAGDSPAAERYTEARLSKFAEFVLLQDIDKNSVDFLPNYDQTTKEPEILPSRIPILLVNGCTGIASGYASSIPCHNVRDVCETVIRIIKNPEIPLKEIAKSLKPDFPTGGVLCSSKAIQNAYKTGKGSVQFRGKIEQTKWHKKDVLVITEIPYGTSIEDIKNAISNACKGTKDKEPIISGISDIIDESGRGKVNIIIVPKQGVDLGVLERLLYKNTPLQSTLKIMLVAVNGDDYRVFNIKELFTEWITFRKDTIKRISQFDIRRFHARIHIIEGLLVAHDNLDSIIKIIRNSENQAEAKEKLQEKFFLSQEQVSAILALPLGKISKLDVKTLKDEKATLEEKVNNLLDLIKNPNKINDLMISQIEDISNKFGNTPRRTIISDIDTEITEEEIIEEQNNLVIITANGFIKRTSADITPQKRGGKGRGGGNIKEGDRINKAFYAKNSDHLMVFTNTGRVFDMKLWQIEESNLKNIGKSINAMLQLKPNEKVCQFLNISKEELASEEGYLVFATKSGLIKKTPLKEYCNIRQTGIIAIKLKDSDSLEDVAYIKNQNSFIFLATRNGIAIQFKQQDIMETGRVAMGTRGINLAKDDEVVSFGIIEEEMPCHVVSISRAGYGKRTDVTEFPIQGRGGKGRTLMKLRDGDCLAKSLLVTEDGDIVVVSNKKIIRIPLEQISFVKRFTLGNKIINLEEDEYVTDFSFTNM